MEKATEHRLAVRLQNGRLVQKSCHRHPPINHTETHMMPEQQVGTKLFYTLPTLPRTLGLASSCRSFVDGWAQEKGQLNISLED